MKKDGERHILAAGFVVLSFLILITMGASCAKTVQEKAPTPVSRHVTVQQYWQTYGEIPQGQWRVRSWDEIKWWQPVPSKKYHLGFTAVHVKDPHWVAITYGVWQAARELGITIDLKAAGGYGDMEGQSRQVEDFAAKGVDGMMIGVVDSAGMSPIIKGVWDKGIFVSYTSTNAEEPHAPSCEADWYISGYQIGDYYGQKYPNTKIVWLLGPPGQTWCDYSNQGFMDAIKKYPSVEILTTKHHEMDMPKIMGLTEDLLTSYPNVNAILGLADFQAKAVIAALRSAGYKPGQVITSGNPVSREALELMKEGWFTIGQSIKGAFVGRVSTWLCVHMLEGNPIPKSVAPPLDIVTIDNLAAVESQLEGWDYAPEGWKPPAVAE